MSYCDVMVTCTMYDVAHLFDLLDFLSLFLDDSK